MRTSKGRRRKPAQVFQTRAITAVRFRETRFACGLSQADAAKFLQVTLRTVHNWETGATRVPYAAYKLVRVLRGGFIPGKAWRGFRIYGDSLHTPEGHRFRAADVSWWSLLCRRAEAFGSVMDRLSPSSSDGAPVAEAAQSGGAALLLGLSALTQQVARGSDTASNNAGCRHLTWATMGPQWCHDGAMMVPSMITVTYGQTTQTRPAQVQPSAPCVTSPGIDRPGGTARAVDQYGVFAGPDQLGRVSTTSHASPASGSSEGRSSASTTHTDGDGSARPESGQERAVPLRQWPQVQVLPWCDLTPAGLSS